VLVSIDLPWVTKYQDIVSSQLGGKDIFKIFLNKRRSSKGNYSGMIRL
jgi:hypothetical protein